MKTQFVSLHALLLPASDATFITAVGGFKQEQRHNFVLSVSIALPKPQAMLRFEYAPQPTDKTKGVKSEILSSCTALTSYRNSATDHTPRN